MKTPTELPDNPEAIRSEIDSTRQRMDQTIDALGQRLKGRHVLDELLHLFRTQHEKGNMNRIKTKIADSASSATQSVARTVKSNPLPFLLIGGGVAWLIYNQTRAKSGDVSFDEDDEDAAMSGSAVSPSDVDLEQDAPVPDATSFAGMEESSDSAGGSLKRKARDVSERMQEGAQRLKQRGEEAAHTVGQKAREIGEETKERARQLYETSRDRVVSTVQDHPLGSALACLGIGLVAGLFLPSPRPLRRAIKPAAHQLRERARDVIERGKRVAETAVGAAKGEAQARGLAPAASG